MPDLARRIKVLHVQRHLVMGGLQNVILGLLRHMDRNLVENAVCCVMEGGFSEEEFRRTGVPVVVLGMPVWKLPLAPFALAKVIREFKPDILHVHLPWLEIVAVIAARLAGGVKVVCHEHARIGSTIIPPWLQGVFARRTARVIAVSDSVARAVLTRLRVSPERVTTVHNAVDLSAVDAAPEVDIRQELGVRPDARLLTFAGRLVRQKGVAELVDAATPIRRSQPDTHIVIIGDGPYMRSFRKRAKRHRVADMVHFVGTRRNVFGILKSTDLYVHPSHNEGLPIVVLEAMGVGVAVVATNVDGTPELVVDGETGYLVPPRDPIAFADAVIRALSDPDRLLEMGRAGRRRIEEQFTFEQAARKVERIYREVMAE